MAALRCTCDAGLSPAAGRPPTPPSLQERLGNQARRVIPPTGGNYYGGSNGHNGSGLADGQVLMLRNELRQQQEFIREQLARQEQQVNGIQQKQQGFDNAQMNTLVAELEEIRSMLKQREEQVVQAQQPPLSVQHHGLPPTYPTSQDEGFAFDANHKKWQEPCLSFLNFSWSYLEFIFSDRTSGCGNNDR